MTDKKPDEQQGLSDDTPLEDTASSEELESGEAPENSELKSRELKSPKPKNTEPNNTESNSTELSDTELESEKEKPVSSSSEKKQENAKVEKKPSTKPEKSGGGWGKAIAVFLLLVICVSGMFAGGWYWANDKFSQIDAKIQEESQSYAQSSALVEVADSLSAELEPVRQENADLKEQIEYLQQKVQSQNLRILSMSTTSREDWLLAEAEYLLKLANQRVLVERNADTAIGLLEEADGILRDLADPDLFPLRKALKGDLVALKLAKKIDIEGIYLELSALSENVTTLPLVPEAYSRDVRDDEETSDAENASKPSVIQRFFGAFSGYVRIIQHDEKPEAILPPEDTKYLHLNLQFMFERAQIALLREQQDIYVENLSRAKNWIVRYFPRSQTSEQFLSQTDALLEKNIVVKLPDISGSLALLHDYINVMHAEGEVGANDSNNEADEAPASGSENTDGAL